ncbi:4a-hydroxytetrahydrobiopterin dehydratase [Aspergillus saccharolyticus JOP 1030-1]|uniref:4a-hydroxytetrahydrobiopterin dehydratase n=1 Tax=Aspergillus saccharolyticus JOP 1030-1 TaxID=1450539 RepID=A0A319AB82_9EURO|nr:transcriptional coactivator/pterin dehydratase [Aspergillus saccharolyticus JOP 1030-1]PYH44202.1 transcriptional coactivator/pterin dehydratase [Aspergillus saccharolyticus JOP 1030-1]
MDHIIRASSRPRAFLSLVQPRHCVRSDLSRGYSSIPSSVWGSRPALRTTQHLLRPTTQALNHLSSTTTPASATPRRLFSSTPTNMASSAVEPQFAEGVDAEVLRPRLAGLLQAEQGWTLDAEGRGMQKTYFFKTYFKAVSFVNVIASQSASVKHHPTMTVRIGSVDIHWTTHHPRGLTGKDVDMAQYCDEAAELMGAVEAGQGRKCH